MDDLERRRFPRGILMCKISAIFEERLLMFNSHTENVGIGGIRAILQEKLHLSTEVEVELFLENREKPLKSKGQIIWVRELNPKNIKPRFFDTGIKFIGMSTSDQELLKNTVHALFVQGDKSDKVIL